MRYVVIWEPLPSHSADHSRKTLTRLAGVMESNCHPLVNPNADVLRNPPKVEYRILCFGVSEATCLASVQESGTRGSRTCRPFCRVRDFGKKVEKDAKLIGMEVEPKMHPYRQTVAYACEPILPLCG